MPNNAMMTVTTADSKYSRMTVFGGPVSFSSFSILTSRSRPFGRTERGVKTSGFSATFLSVVVTGSFITDILDAVNSQGQAVRGAQTAPTSGNRRHPGNLFFSTTCD